MQTAVIAVDTIAGNVDATTKNVYTVRLPTTVPINVCIVWQYDFVYE